MSAATLLIFTPVGRLRLVSNGRTLTNLRRKRYLLEL